MSFLLGMCITILLPFALLRLLGYKKGFHLGILVLLALGIYFLAFAGGLALTAMFEHGNSSYWKEYERAMPVMYSAEYKRSMTYESTLIDWSGLPAILLLDAMRISLHFLLTHAKLPMWVMMIPAMYLIKTIIVCNYIEFIPRRRRSIMIREKNELNRFGRREISPADEDAEICAAIEKIKACYQ